MATHSRVLAWRIPGTGVYSGICDLTDEKEALFSSGGAFKGIMRDVAKNSGVKYYDLKEGEVARAEFFGKELVLTENEMRIE